MKYGNFTQQDRYFKEQSFGRNGFRIVESGTSLPEAEAYSVLQVIEEAEVTVVSQTGDSLNSETLTVGTTLYGLFSNVVVASGKLIAYIA